MKNIFRSFVSRRRSAMVGVAGAAMIAVLSGAQAQDAPAAGKAAKKPSQIAVIAHRGGAMSRPENTMPAFSYAHQLGVDVLEFDLLMTADDQVVVYHDATINPEFCKSGAGTSVPGAPVRSMTLAEIQALDCGSGARKAYNVKGFRPVPGARIPTLEEVLGAFRARNVLFFPETKVPKGAPGMAEIDPVKFASLLNDAVVKNGLEDRVILQSFDFRTIDALHKINPRIRTCLLGAQKFTRDYLPVLRRHNATCIVLSDKDIDAAGIRGLQKEGILVYSGVVDTPKEWQTYVDLGVDAIFTNDPEGAIGFLKRSDLRK